MTGEERAKIDDLYSKAIEWAEEGIRLWADEEYVEKWATNADKAQGNVEMYRFVKKCVETAYPILQAEERILMGEPKRQPVGIADQLTREGADPLTRAEQLLLVQMQQLQTTTTEILSDGGNKFELVNTAEKAQQLTKGMCRLSMELRLLQHLKQQTTIDGEVRSYIPPQTLQEAVAAHKRLREARGVQPT